MINNAIALNLRIKHKPWYFRLRSLAHLDYTLDWEFLSLFLFYFIVGRTAKCYIVLHDNDKVIRYLDYKKWVVLNG